MVSKLNKVLQVIRDVLIILLSVLVLIRFFGIGVTEIASADMNPKPDIVTYIFIGIFIFFILLSLINILLIIIKIQNKVYYYFNALFQIIAAVIMMLGFNSALISLPLIVLNVIILITLRNKK